MKQIIKNLILALTAFLVPLVTFVVAREIKENPPQIEQLSEEPKYQPEVIDIPEKRPLRNIIKKPIQRLVRVETPEPRWTTHEPVTSPNPSLGNVLSDIDSHMTPGHIYRDSDRVTWGHETTHGIASLLRKKAGVGYEGLYVLENRAVLLKNPQLLMSHVAVNIPQSLRGMAYQLYMIDQTRQWNDFPLYILEEWVCYANGAAVRAELGIHNRAETVQQMLEFMNYSLCLLMTMEQRQISIDPELKIFVQWHCRRTSQLFHSNGRVRPEQWQLLMSSPDAERLREFCRNCFGKAWTKQILGF